MKGEYVDCKVNNWCVCVCFLSVCMYVYLGVNRQKYVKENTQLNSTSQTKQEIYSRNGQSIEQDGSEGKRAD